MSLMFRINRWTFHKLSIKCLDLQFLIIIACNMLLNQPATSSCQIEPTFYQNKLRKWFRLLRVWTNCYNLLVLVWKLTVCFRLESDKMPLSSGSWGVCGHMCVALGICVCVCLCECLDVSVFVWVFVYVIVCGVYYRCITIQFVSTC